MSTLRSKAARHQLIADLISRQQVRTQDQLRSLLADAGFNVTQATLSRDLDELGALKTIVNGSTLYALATSQGLSLLPDLDSDARLARVTSEVLTNIVAAQNLVVAHTRPGAAHYLASAIDRDAWPEVVGSVAGDDTVLIIATDNAAAAAVAEQLAELAGSRIPKRGSGVSNG